MRPGTSHLPVRSIVSTPSGTSISPRRKTLRILPPSTRTTASGIGGRSVPSIRTAPVKALTCNESPNPSDRHARRRQTLRGHADFLFLVQPALLVGADVDLA